MDMEVKVPNMVLLNQLENDVMAQVDVSPLLVPTKIFVAIEDSLLYHQMDGFKVLVKGSVHNSRFNAPPMDTGLAINLDPSINVRWLVTHLNTGIAIDIQFRTKEEAANFAATLHELWPFWEHTEDVYSDLPTRVTRWINNFSVAYS